MKPEFESAIYRGSVRHRRFTPTRHSFEQSLFMLLLKTDEIPTLLRHFWQLGDNRLRWARFRRADYVGDGTTEIGAAAKQKMAELLGQPAHELSGDVFLLCHLRYLGFYFSPLNLYYLRQEGRFRYLLAEVSNTPWNERHYYLLDLLDPQPHAKAFHVSPFNPMQQSYRWRLLPPDSEGGHLSVHIESRTAGDTAARTFDATLSLNRLALNQSNLNRVLLRWPVQTLSVLIGIHWQALRLLLKRTPLYRHPGKTGTEIKKGTL